MPMKTITLDVHAHLIPLKPGDACDMEGVSWTSYGRLQLDEAVLAKAELYDAEALITWMDAHGVGNAWVSVPPTLYRAHLGADEAGRWAEALNAGLAAITALHPDRLAPLFHLPMQHPAVAHSVAMTASADGQRRFAMAAGDSIRNHMLSDPEFDPLWICLDEVQAFLLLHPAHACDPRLKRFSLINLLGGPTETALAGAHLAMSGVPERHPGITFCLAHGGGTLAAVSGRLQRGQDTGRAGSYLGGEKIRQAMRRFCVDCITHDGASLELVADAFGADRILFGSDWPFDMGLSEPGQQLSDVSESLRERVLRSNGQPLLEAHVKKTLSRM